MDTNVLKQRQVAIDRQQLGLTNDILDILTAKNKDIPSDAAKRTLFARWSMEWKDFSPSSSALDRLLFISKLFDEHFVNPLFGIDVDAVNIDEVIYVDLFTECLSGYDVVLFLNDLHEIQSVLGDSPNAVHCDSTESERECVGDVMREYRERERVDDEVDSKMDQKHEEFHQFMHGLDERERAIIEISTKMHDVLCHSESTKKEDDEQYEVRPLDWWKHRETQIASKFVNEVLEENEQKESEQESGGRMDEINEVLMDCWIREGVYAKIKGMDDDHRLNGKKVRIHCVLEKKRKCAVKLSESELEEEMKLPATYVVVAKNGIPCKQTRRLDSKMLCTLPTGSVVNVLEIDGRRARIDHPVKGWVSVQLPKGYVFLERIKLIRHGQLGPVDDIGMKQSECEQFTKYLNENRYDSETVLDDLIDEEDDPFNEFMDSNLFPMLKNSKFLTKIVKKHLGGKRNDDDKLPSFQFGERVWYFWKYYKDWNNYNVAKHSNLKDECLNNKIHSISLDRFMKILAKAVLLRQSKKGRTIKAMDGGVTNGRLEIPPKLPLSVSHIVVLLMYCNESELQYKYKKYGTRKMGKKQTREEFKAMNSEIGIWYTLLCEVVTLFGTFCSPKNVFYTGLNVRLSFESFATIFLAPFSTTISVDVANRFCDGAGIILMLIPSSGSLDKYFDVEWLSDFWHEKERLFFKGDGLSIADIQFVDRGQFTKNGRYLKAFTIFSKLFQGHFLGEIKGQRKAEGILLNLVAVFCANNGIGKHWELSVQSVPISLYIQQLFFNLIQAFKSTPKHFVILSEFKKLSDELQEKLFHFERDESDIGQLTLSPFLDSLCVAKNICFVQEFLWLVHNQEMKQLQSGSAEYMLYSEEYHYKLDGGKQISFVFGVGRKASGSNKASFGVKIRNCPDGMCKDGKISVVVDEVDYCKNAHPLIKMKRGSFSGFWAFGDELVEKVQSLTIRTAITFQ